MGIKIGQTVHTVTYNWGNRAPIVKEAKVSKVGKKYFYLEGYTRSKFSLETFKMITNYSSTCTVYTDIEEYNKKVELKELQVKIKQAFNQYGPCKFTLEQLRAVDQILNTNE